VLLRAGLDAAEGNQRQAPAGFVQQTRSTGPILLNLDNVAEALSAVEGEDWR